MCLFSKDESFAAVQSMVMYIIMRMADKEATENDITSDMYAVMVRLAFCFQKILASQL
jgi:hypothetical protein